MNVFLANMKEIKDKYWKGLLLCLESYFKLRKNLREFLPKLTEAKIYNHLEQKVHLSTGKLLQIDMEGRDKLNKYVEATIAHTIEKQAIDRLDKNRDFLFLFRLLTSIFLFTNYLVKHRIRYPMRG